MHCLAGRIHYSLGSVNSQRNRPNPLNHDNQTYPEWKVFLYQKQPSHLLLSEGFQRLWQLCIPSSRDGHSQNTHIKKQAYRKERRTHKCQKHRHRSAVETHRQPKVTDCSVVPDLCAFRFTQEQTVASVRQTSI